MKPIFFLILFSAPLIFAENSTEPTVLTTGYSSMCQSCIDFLEHLPGFLDKYSPDLGIDADTL
ncbi:Saposin B-type domain-containing protein [Caenorhabditis elegans]|uniref:Saposin B-type domain-containing protein n=1 Tax=Caenorhabditis elegans TaxID=6239 RepID=G1K0Z1_CAEEL|nr:Saposin B-type domain-containing protein [Caenorhabditis elegans]CCC42182.1 Saposin B-type domain-containing protein [Caenorhabditis elegans]|eukprot:NP_001256753.1 Uncharacterized protein CELE_F59A1.18 [Caenorhabditis elegans]